MIARVLLWGSEGKMSTPISNTLNKKYQLVSTGTNKYIPTGISTDTNKYDNDLLFDELSDLVNPSFRAWYCKQFYKLGNQRVLQLASQARADGKNPKKLFSHLLKRASNG